MSTPEECRQNAKDCLKLANDTKEIYAKTALIELAMELLATAEAMERGSTTKTGGRSA